jgi:hypothetical protein
MRLKIGLVKQSMVCLLKIKPYKAL